MERGRGGERGEAERGGGGEKEMERAREMERGEGEGERGGESDRKTKLECATPLTSHISSPRHAPPAGKHEIDRFYHKVNNQLLADLDVPYVSGPGNGVAYIGLEARTPAQKLDGTTNSRTAGTHSPK